MTFQFEVFPVVGPDDNPRANGKVFQLLRAVRETGSLHRAAKQVGLSYRHAWGVMRAWEEMLGRSLLDMERGRGASLTLFGERMLRAEMRLLLEDYLATTRDDLRELRAAQASGDLERLARQAHKLKGAARLVGALPLAGAALALESAAKGGQWDQVLPHATDVATAFERLDRYVAETFGADQ